METTTLASVEASIDLLTPAEGEAIAKLKELYPLACGLRSHTLPTIVPVFLGKQEGLVYEVLADNGDNYSNFYYILYMNGQWKTICNGPQKAAIGDGSGIFFIGKWGSELYVRYYPVFSSGKPGQIIFQNITDQIQQLRISPFGLYVEGFSQGRPELYFLENKNIAGLFECDSSPGRPIVFPGWADRTTWQPGMEEGYLYFSDDSTIYKLGLGKNHSYYDRIYAHPDPYVRFGPEYYSWGYSYLPSKVKFFVQGAEIRVSHRVFESHVSWVFWGDGILAADQYADGTLRLIYEEEKNMRSEIKEFSSVRTGSIIRMHRNAAFLQVHNRWYKITKK